MALTADQVCALIDKEQAQHCFIAVQGSALDEVLQSIDTIASDWLAAAGEAYSGNGTDEMAAKWRGLDPKGDDVAKFYQREDVSLSMVRELSAWHATDPNVRKQSAAIMKFTEGPRILDFGGGIGTLAIALALYSEKLNLDFEIEVVEPGPWCRVFAKEQAARLGARISFIEKPTGEYNTIIGMDVVEHLARPASFLELAHEHLVDSGVLACNWVFYQSEAHPQHIAECTPEAIEFHSELDKLFGPRDESAIVTSNGWPSIHRKKEK